MSPSTDTEDMSSKASSEAEVTASVGGPSCPDDTEASTSIPLEEEGPMWRLSLLPRLRGATRGGRRSLVLPVLQPCWHDMLGAAKWHHLPARQPPDGAPQGSLIGGDTPCSSSCISGELSIAKESSYSGVLFLVRRHLFVWFFLAYVWCLDLVDLASAFVSRKTVKGATLMTMKGTYVSGKIVFQEKWSLLLRSL